MARAKRTAGAGTATQRCTQPGCSGSYLDGYCDVCGSPQSPATHGVPAGPAGANGASPSPATPATGVLVTGPDGRTGIDVDGDGIPDLPGPLDSARVTSPSSRLPSARIGSARAAAGSTRTRRTGSASTRTRAARLGAGLTVVPPVPALDPAAAVMKDPQVPENRRFCSACGEPVGRGRDGRPGRQQGFCPQCRTPFSFTPKLSPGELVAGQYHVAGCLAHGGLGWIYLARDRNVSDRWVVLKGLLNAGDADAYAAAVAEREFLAKVAHPLIVEIYNFVLHDGAGYIVMEYVGGTSLKGLLKQRMQANGGRYDPIPVDQAIAYLLEVLPAFSYLHDSGLLYCDFKPDNIIQVGDEVKLIDLGGVRRIDDLDSAIYGTVGYQAPEVPTAGPSIASDIYTIGRTLAVLVMEFRGYQTAYVDSLPAQTDVPVLAQHDSLYRLLAKACAPSPDDRFTTAEELRQQLLGVLREVVATRPGAPAVAEHTVASTAFEAPTATGDRLTWDALPALRVNPDDPQAAWLASVTVTDPAQRLGTLTGHGKGRSAEVRLATARTAIECGRLDVAHAEVGRLLADDPWEWRALWLEGLGYLAEGKPREALASFNAVTSQVPGELAPKLALALACEQAGDAEVARGLYRVCAATDAGYAATAAFGLERIAAAQQDLDGALAALELVPTTSRAYGRAQRRRVELLVERPAAVTEVARGLATLDGLNLDAAQAARLRAQGLRAALDLVVTSGEQPSTTVAGVPATQAAVRAELERTLRDLARLSGDRDEAIALVDEANRVRPRTLW